MTSTKQQKPSGEGSSNGSVKIRAKLVYKDGLRRCNTCNTFKETSCFYKDNTIKDGLRRMCDVCSRLYYNEYCKTHKEAINRSRRKYRQKNPRRNYAWQCRAKYGLEPAVVNSIIMKQKGNCAICDVRQLDKRLAIDHDHKANLIRGLLCSHCNHGLGHFKDSPGLLIKAAEYLRNHLNIPCVPKGRFK